MPRGLKPVQSAEHEGLIARENGKLEILGELKVIENSGFFEIEILFHREGKRKDFLIPLYELIEQHEMDESIVKITIEKVNNSHGTNEKDCVDN